MSKDDIHINTKDYDRLRVTLHQCADGALIDISATDYGDDLRGAPSFSMMVHDVSGKDLRALRNAIDRYLVALSRQAMRVAS